MSAYQCLNCEQIERSDEKCCEDPDLFCINDMPGEIKRLHAQRDALLEALKDLVGCPYDIDRATVPKAGIDAAPDQVVGTMSVALVRHRKARAAIKAAEENT